MPFATLCPFARVAVLTVGAFHHVTARFGPEHRGANEVRAEVRWRLVEVATLAEVVAPRVGGRAAQVLRGRDRWRSRPCDCRYRRWDRRASRPVSRRDGGVASRFPVWFACRVLGRVTRRCVGRFPARLSRSGRPLGRRRGRLPAAVGRQGSREQRFCRSDRTHCLPRLDVANQSDGEQRCCCHRKQI